MHSWCFSSGFLLLPFKSEEAFGYCFYCVEPRIQSKVNILELIHICPVGTDL